MLNDMNNWKNIWNSNRGSIDDVNFSDIKDVIKTLKQINGFDVQAGGLSYEAIISQYNKTRAMMKICEGDSVFEVGCGSGANLYLFHKDRHTIGGEDYSARMVDICRSLFLDNIKECICCEAKDVPIEIKYDHVFANSVFSYFPNLKYSEIVLNKMVEKANKSIVLLDVHDVEKKEDFLEYRRKTITNYNARYKGLDKLFYNKEYFKEFATRNNLNICFEKSDMDGYWNNDFVYHVCIYK